MIPSQFLPPNHEGIPKWKQELLQRVKHESVTLVSSKGALKLTVTRPNQGRKSSLTSSLKFKSLTNLSTYSAQTAFVDPEETVQIGNHESGNNVQSKTLPNRRLNHSISDGSYHMTDKTPKVDIKLQINDRDYHSDSSDELDYSPGVITVIKDKYLTKCSSPPPVKNLERRSMSRESLENGDTNRLKPKYVLSSKPSNFKTNHYQERYLNSIKDSSNNQESNKKPNSNSSDEVSEENLVKRRAKLFENLNPKSNLKLNGKKNNKLTIIFRENINSNDTMNKVNSNKTLFSPKTPTSPKPLLPPKSPLLPKNPPPQKTNELLQNKEDYLIVT